MPMPQDDWMTGLTYDPAQKPQDFDFQNYLKTNTDLGAAGVDTEEEALRHYLNYGIAENRSLGNPQSTQANSAATTTATTTPVVAPTNDWMPNQFYNPNVMPENFDWQRYVGANQDLGAAGIDTQEEAMRHYFNYGKQEGRNIGALAPKKYEDLSREDARAGVEAYRQATGDDRGIVFNPGTDSSNDPILSWINQNYIPQGQFKTDYAAAKPADTFDLLSNLKTSTRPPDQLASIQKAWEANKDKPSEMRRLMEEYGVTLGDLSQATGETYSQLNTWVQSGDALGLVGFSVNRPGAYDKYKKQTTAKYDPNATVVAGPSTAASREADYRSSQQKAKHTFDPVAYAKDPEAYVKKMREQGGLAALVAEKAVPTIPKVTTAQSTTASTGNKLTVFGDSISSSTGYNQNASPTRSNLAADLGSSLGLNTINNAIAGQTSSDALNGNYNDYLSKEKPETVVLRFGAADAIKLNDPSLSLSNIEKMVQEAQKNGSKPVLVGVTPFSKMGEISTGNITSSGITDSMVESADKINAGIKQLADKYGVQFVDVRKVEVPAGGLVDGVHPNDKYGTALNSYISDQIKSGGGTSTPSTKSIALASTTKGEGGIKDLVTTPAATTQAIPKPPVVLPTTTPTTTTTPATTAQAKPEASVINPAPVPIDTLALAKSLDLSTAPDYSALAGYKPIATDGGNAATATTATATGKITPANFQSEYNALKANPNLNEDQMRDFLTTSLQDPTIKAKLGDKLQPALDELNRPPAERMLGQIEKQRGALGDQYYQGVYSDPKTMAKILEDKGVKSLADLGQKEKFQTYTAEQMGYATPDGRKLTEFQDGTFGYVEGDPENGEWKFVPKDQVKPLYVGDEDQVLTEKEVATLKDGKYQKNIGNVVINKRTGEELTDTTRQLAYQSSSGGANKKHNHLVVEFTKDGTPVLVATKEKAGFGALLQEYGPVISMALPFILPGIGTALSSALPGAAVAASGATAAIPASLMNTALTQGIISGGIGTLGGQDFGKSFLSGAISPVISSGIGSLLPNIGLDAASGAGRAITGAGTGVVKGLLQGGDFEDLLKQGALSGLTNYGLGEATKGMDLTPQQLNMATSVVSPLLQGKKIDPMKVLSSAITSGIRSKPKEEVPGNARGGLLEGPVPVKVPGNAYGMDPRMLSGIATNMMARSM